MSERVLLEPSFADVAEAIEAATDLPVRIRSYWLCALRQIAKAMDKPWETIPARWTAARFAIGRLHHALVGANAKTLANHKSNARAALMWFGKEKGVPSRGMPFTADWDVLRKKLSDTRSRSVLSSLMRYCSAQGIAPDAVDEAVLDRYMRYRAETTALATDTAARRAIARVWNGCAEMVEGWPAQRLSKPAIKTMAGPAWEEFPEGLRTDLENHLQGLKRIRRTGNGKRVRPCKDSTIKMRRASIVAAARTAVGEGVPITQLTSLKALLDPEVAGTIIDAYWKADGEEPSTYTIDLGSRFLSMARELGCFDEEALDQLMEIRDSLEIYRRRRDDPQESGGHSPGSERRCLGQGGQSSGCLDEASAPVAGRGAYQSRRHCAAGSRDRHRNGRPGSPWQPEPHHAGPEPDQARRAAHALSIGVPAV